MKQLKRAPAIFIDSFSGPAADLPRGKRTPASVLAALRINPRVSCFDMSEHCKWLPDCIDKLKLAGSIKEVPSDYPWCVYEVQPDAGAQGIER